MRGQQTPDEATQSGEGKNLHPGVHRGEPNRKGSNKQIAAKQDCYRGLKANKLQDDLQDQKLLVTGR